MFSRLSLCLLVLTASVSAISRQASSAGILSDGNTVEDQLQALDVANEEEKMTDDELATLAKYFTPEQIMKVNEHLAKEDSVPDPESTMRFAQTKGFLPKSVKTFGKGLAAGMGAAMGANKPTQSFSGAHSAITPQDEACVMCQYLVEKVQAAVMEFTQSPAPPTFLETEETVTETAEPAATSFLETEVKVGAKAKGFVGTASSVSGTSGGGVLGLLKKGGMGTSAASDIGFTTSGRKRSVEFLGDMPADLRFSPITNPNANAEQDRAKYKLMEMEVFSMMYQMCSTNMPLMYLTYCQALMHNFQRILQSLQYGDRTDQICLMIGQCLEDSYAAINPHALVRVQPAELKARIQTAIAMSPTNVVKKKE